MSQYILDKAYRMTSSEGVPAHRVVVQGANAGDCTVPRVPNAGAILGVTTHAQPQYGQNVGVRKAGIAQVVVYGIVYPGDPIILSDIGGGIVESIAGHVGAVDCLGFAETGSDGAGEGDQLIEVFISLHQRVVQDVVKTPMNEGDSKIESVKITYRGWAGHLCVGLDCEFHLNTLLEYETLRIIVSTVGRYRPRHSPEKYEEIGHNRFFETMVFHTMEDNQFIDTDVNRGELSFESEGAWSSKDMELEATKGHWKTVEEIRTRLLGGDKFDQQVS